jgi:hypothetical protein
MRPSNSRKMLPNRGEEDEKKKKKKRSYAHNKILGIEEIRLIYYSL